MTDTRTTLNRSATTDTRSACLWCGDEATFTGPDGSFCTDDHEHQHRGSETTIRRRWAA